MSTLSEFPKKAAVWPGCMLASIAHAVFTARAPVLSYEQSWDSRNYSVQDSAGSRGTIVFAPNRTDCVAVFYLKTSPRNPLRSGDSIPSTMNRLLQGMPASLDALAKKALQYVLQEVSGSPISVITSALWILNNTTCLTVPRLNTSPCLTKRT